MKKCVNCNIRVGGSTDTCPLCQNSLSGEATADNWPSIDKFRKQAMAYSIQLFILLTLTAVSLGLDFLFELNNGKHWSLIVLMSVLMGEILARGYLKKNIVFVKVVNISFLHIFMIILFASWYYGFLGPMAHFAIPIAISVLTVLDWILAVIDKKGNALVYLLILQVVSIIAYAILFIGKFERTLPWDISIIISVVSLIGIFVFRGKKVTGELEKRMNI